MTRQCGFGAIAAIVILVILAVLGAAIVSIGTTQQITSAQDVTSARAWQAARAGNEWGLSQALNARDWAGPGTTCDTATRTVTLNLVAATGFNATVTCNSWLYNEGETTPGTARTVRVFRITAVACPSAACPDITAAVAGAGYVERTRVVLATNQ
jgi:MSHA biogenesis protein MshP